MGIGNSRLVAIWRVATGDLGPWARPWKGAHRGLKCLARGTEMWPFARIRGLPNFSRFTSDLNILRGPYWEEYSKWPLWRHARQLVDELDPRHREGIGRPEVEQWPNFRISATSVCLSPFTGLRADAFKGVFGSLLSQHHNCLDCM